MRDLTQGNLKLKTKILKEMSILSGHSFNVLHLYCKLIKTGIPKKSAGKACRAVEPLINFLIY